MKKIYLGFFFQYTRLERVIQVIFKLCYKRSVLINKCCKKLNESMIKGGN